MEDIYCKRYTLQVSKNKIVLPVIICLKKCIKLPNKRRKAKNNKHIFLKNVTSNNLKGVNLKIL